MTPPLNPPPVPDPYFPRPEPNDAPDPRHQIFIHLPDTTAFTIETNNPANSSSSLSPSSTPTPSIKDLAALLTSAITTTTTIHPTQIPPNLPSLLTANPTLLPSINLSPNNLQHLVEYNPMLAAHLLTYLLTTPHATSYLSALVSMDMSLHSMELVNRLSLEVTLPEDFVSLYISNCISSCSLQTDKYLQVREGREGGGG